MEKSLEVFMQSLCGRIFTLPLLRFLLSILNAPTTFVCSELLRKIQTLRLLLSFGIMREDIVKNALMTFCHLEINAKTPRRLLPTRNYCEKSKRSGEFCHSE